MLAKRRIETRCIEAEIDDGLLRALRVESSPDRETRERGGSDAGRIDFEETPQVLAIFTAPESVGTERGQTAGQPGRDLIGHDLHVIRSRDDRHVAVSQRFENVRLAPRLGGMKTVPTLHAQRLAPQLGVTGDAPHIGADFVFLC